METTGLLVVAGVLVLGVAVGVWRRRVDGRLRSARPGLVAPAAIADAAGDGGAYGGSRRAGDLGAAGQRIDAALLAVLKVQPAAATLVQFSTAFCTPCRAVCRVCTEVVALLPEVQYVQVDAESHLDAVRALGVWRTPTLFVLDGDGRVVRRATGVPGKAQLIAVLGEILTPA